ncbi:MAG: hypothetical protein ACI80N_000921 [Gammaproteobacteria bacterium]|jgi:hypothetical protein
MKPAAPLRARRLAPTCGPGLVLLAGTWLASIACSPATEPATQVGTVNPVVVIGVDGLDPKVLDDLLQAGRLPNFQRFADKGTIGRLRTMSPTLSPVLWTTIATGQPLEKHGIVDFQDTNDHPFTSNARKVPALWNIASQRDRTVNCVGWWVTWPAEPVNGNMVASYAAQAQASVVWKPGTWEKLRDQTFPAELVERTRPLMIFARDAQEIRSRLWKRFPQPTMLDKVSTDSVSVLGWTYAADLSFAAIAAELLRTEPADLNMVYMALPDVAGHRFWSSHRPQDFNIKISEPKRSDFADYVNLAYEEADRLVGTIVDAAPDNANIIVLSDHGMRVFDIARNDPERPVTGNHAGDVVGVIAAMGPEIRQLGNMIPKVRQSMMGGLLDVAPLVLHLMQEPVPDHWPKVGRGVDLERMLKEDWRADHPPQTVASDDDWFRESTESIVPGRGLDRKFIRSFQALGYALREPGEDDEPSQDPE